MRPPITPFFVLRYTLGQPEGWAFLLSSFFGSLIGLSDISFFGGIIFILAVLISCLSLYSIIKKVIKINFLVQNWNATVAIFSRHEISESYEGDRKLFFKYVINGKEYETSFKKVYQWDYDWETVIVDERDYENQMLLYNPKNPKEVVYINEEPHAIRDYFLDNGLMQS